MGLHQFYYTGGGICVKIYNNTFKGGGDLKYELDMCLWNTDAPGGNKVKYGKNL